MPKVSHTVPRTRYHQGKRSETWAAGNTLGTGGPILGSLELFRAPSRGLLATSGQGLTLGTENALGVHVEQHRHAKRRSTPGVGERGCPSLQESSNSVNRHDSSG
jgi:hypothetical protein